LDGGSIARGADIDPLPPVNFAELPTALLMGGFDRSQPRVFCGQITPNPHPEVNQVIDRLPREGLW